MAGTNYQHTQHYISLLLQAHPHRRPSTVQDGPSLATASADLVPSPIGSRLAPALPPSSLSREQLVEQLVDLIVMEEEDAAKDLMGEELGLKPGDSALDQYILSLMHKVRDDMNQVPFSPTSMVTPKRPAVRKSSSTLSKSAITFRPLTPLASQALPISPSAVGSSASPSTSFSSLSASPSRPYLPGSEALRTSFSSSSTHTSPGLLHAAVAIPSPPSSGASPSPILSPKTLSAKAVEFKPSPRSSHASIATTSPFASGSPSSPVDWSIGSSLGNGSRAPSLGKPISALSLASPMRSDSSTLPPAPSSLLKHPSPYSRIDDNDEEEDDFSPFGSLPAHTGSPSLHHLQPEDPTWASSSVSAGSYSSSTSFPQMTMGEMDELYAASGVMGEEYSQAGMTPMDLLCSIFTGLSTHEVEVALHKHGYDFESTMAHLMVSSSSTTAAAAEDVSGLPPLPTTTTSSAVPITSPLAKPFVPREGYVVAGGRNGAIPIRPPSPSSSFGLSGVGGVKGAGGGFGGRVCRYYLNGECRRADCRFSHDIERALCRFWLRGQCAKGDQCEFIHTLPPTFDPETLSPATVGLMDVSPSESPTPTTPLPEEDDFPVLGGGTVKSVPKGPVKTENSKTRFSSAVKKAAVAAPASTRSTSSSALSSPAPTPIRSNHAPSSLTASLPRSSSRITLRPPTLLPTLPTGQALNAMYMSARARAIDLGTQRNAYLAKAAEAWKRGDGASAKRFSKEGQGLNDRMNGENMAAADKLVRDRLKIVQDAARSREGRTTDPRDRSRKGVLCGGSLGVLLGVASSGGSSSQEREEALVDVHLLHGEEAVSVLERWLLALESEGFLGLAYVVVGEEKHTGTQDAGRGASKVRLGQSVKTWLAQWHYPWSESGGIICIDPLSHLES